MFVCICLIGFSKVSEVGPNDLELSTEEKRLNKGLAIIFALCASLMSVIRNVFIRKLQVENYADFDRAYDACLLMSSFSTIVFIFVVYSIGVNLQLIFVGTCAGLSIFLAPILIVISISTGHASVAHVLIGSFSIWQTFMELIFDGQQFNLLQGFGLALGILSMI